MSNGHMTSKRLKHTGHTAGLNSYCWLLNFSRVINCVDATEVILTSFLLGEKKLTWGTGSSNYSTITMDHFPSLAAKRKATNKAQAGVTKFNTEEKVLQHLLDTKPAILCCGKELWLDKANIVGDVDGYIERFVRKGFGDRSERLSYLQSTLKQKWDDKPEKFLSMMGFLLALEDNSTNVDHKIELGTKKYSKLPDFQVERISDIKKREAEEELKRELLMDIANDRNEIVYSEDSDLSDWDTDESKIKEDDNVEGEVVIAGESKAFVGFSDDFSPEAEHLDPKSRQAEWRKASQEATGILKKSIRQIKSTPLLSQPVVSSQVDLHLKFGKFWEWKKWHAHRSNPNLHVLYEEDMIREILWSFQKPCTLNSTVFTNRCCFHPKHIISTTSQATLRALINEYGKTISAFGGLQSFVRQVLGPSAKDQGSETLKFPKIIQAFAHGMSVVLSHVSVYVGSLDSHPIHRDSNLRSSDTDNVCSTLLQLHRRMRQPIIILRSLENIFNQSLGDLSAVVKPEVYNSWISTVKLISVLEMALSVERKPEVWRIVLFLFSHCLRAFLDDFLSPLGTQYWHQTCIFKRNRNVNVSDSNFWAVAVTVHPYEETLQKQHVEPLSCLKNIVPKMLVFLKVVEMLRQLEENVGAITGELPDSKFIVQSDRRVLSSFHSVLQLQNSPNCSQISRCDYTQLTTYLKIANIPSAGSQEILPSTVDSCLNPIFAKGAREDFAQSVLQLTLKPRVSTRFTYEDSTLKDPQYQKLLNDCYPDGRENFDINFRLDSKSDVKCEFLVKAKFPLNVLLTPESIRKYLYVSQQLLRVRKSVWTLSSLQLKDCKPAQGVTMNRLYLLRFSLLHFCSSLRGFFTLKVFSHDFCAPDDYGDLNEVLLAHENYLQRIELRLLKIKFMDAIIIKKMVSMSEALQKMWDKGLALSIVIKLEECLKQCWYAVNDFCKGTTNQEYNELYYHLGPTPSYL
ncbi:unnamed protein product [Allacma fusca]|uniref:Gamma-tubulin complex component n=1 Tax=Allacma fusca TaxID=39272 RepID=A0A8J2L1H5_9HEXA|nr:unnamed protein product [Allacma fusca]